MAPGSGSKRQCFVPTNKFVQHSVIWGQKLSKVKVTHSVRKGERGTGFSLRSPINRALKNRKKFTLGKEGSLHIQRRSVWTAGCVCGATDGSHGWDCLGRN